VDRWLLIRDILLTGTGIVLILSQIFLRNPHYEFLATGLALTAPSIVVHTKELMSGRAGHTAGGSSSPSPAPGPAPSGPHSGGSGD
jgi:hypothetical protein